MAKLTAKQKDLFDKIESKLRKEVAAAFIKQGFKNGTKAYLKACKNLNRKRSKNPETSASEILNYPNVDKFIDSIRDDIAGAAKVDAEWVLKNLKSVAERCMTAEPVMIKVDGEMIETGEYRFDSSGANKSLELIGKTMKMFTDKIELDGKLIVKTIRKRFDGSE